MACSRGFGPLQEFYDGGDDAFERLVVEPSDLGDQQGGVRGKESGWPRKAGDPE